MKDKYKIQILVNVTDVTDKHPCEEDINFGCKYN